MNFLTNLKDLYYILPFLDSVKNKYGLIFDVISGSKFRLKLKVGVDLTLNRDQLVTMIDLLGAITFATSCEKVSQNTIELSFDQKNKFRVSLDNLSIENTKLLELLFNGTRFGATFIKSSGQDNFSVARKTLKIIENQKTIVETSNGLRFYLEHISPGTIIEAFIRDIHNVGEFDDWNNKIVVDVGAECGDTAIYYASKGAKVYSFEPMKAHFDAMIKNLSLNPQISQRVTPTNAAIGEDGELTFYHSNRADIAEGASFVYNTHGSTAKISKVKGYSLNTVYSEFGLSHVDLLKMDCKGCEFNLVDENLKIVDNIKIEYLVYDNKHRLEDLLDVLKRNNFQYIIFRHEPIFYRSNSFSATIYANKKK